MATSYPLMYPGMMGMDRTREAVPVATAYPGRPLNRITTPYTNGGNTGIVPPSMSTPTPPQVVPGMQTGGPLPPQVVPPMRTGGPLPPQERPPMQTGGPLPPQQLPDMRTGGPLPPQVQTMHTGGPLPPQQMSMDDRMRAGMPLGSGSTLPGRVRPPTLPADTAMRQRPTTSTGLPSPVSGPTGRPAGGMFPRLG